MNAQFKKIAIKINLNLLQNLNHFQLRSIRYWINYFIIIIIIIRLIYDYNINNLQNYNIIFI